MPALRGRRDRAAADRLGQEEHVARRGRSSCARRARGCTTPVTAMPYLGSGSSIEWPPTIGTPASAATSAPPSRICASVSAPEPVERERDQVERGQRLRAHRVHVGERVRRGDPAEVARVVDDRREEVDGLHERQLVGDPVDARVVAGLGADQQRRVVLRGQPRRAPPAAGPGRSCRRSPRRGRDRSDGPVRRAPCRHYSSPTLMPERFTDEQLSAALEALTDPERFREIERRVATAAPQLQQILATALAEGGWFDSTHEQQLASVAAIEDPGGAPHALPHAARRGDAHRHARRRRGRLGAGARAWLRTRLRASRFPTGGLTWTSAISATPPSSSSTATRACSSTRS